jgi:Icc-related predicted phosphoesterase
MVRILAMSDLHLEFANFALEVSTWPDLIVLAGDIGHGTAGIEFARQQIPISVPVIVLAGNHEFYGSSVETVTRAVRAAAEELSNVHFLDRNEITIHIADRNVRILGATLWTDFALRGEAMRARDMAVAHHRMNDFRLIEFRGRPLTPDDTADFHEAARNWLDAKLAEPHQGPTIVATHHSPSERSEEPRYAGGDLTAAFHSNLEWIIARYQPDLWIHGHSHWSVDYQIGCTRVFSNQRGYPGEQCGFAVRSIDL